jgi:PBSX family phage terminase large subunit
MKARQKQSKFKFQPFSRHQKKVLTWWREGSPYKDYDGIIADGAIRSGKTIAFILGFVLWSTSTFTGQNFIISGKSIGTLKRNIVGPILLILRALGIQYAYNRSENFLAFSGNTYYLFGANNEASQDTLQGITAAGWLADEVALQPQSFIEQAFGRCSVESSKYWLNCNPENPRHYIKTEVIDKAKEKRFLHVHFALDDNLTLSEKIKNRYRRMFSGVWYKRFILGLWVAAEGAIYDMFDDSVHVVDKVPDIVRYWIAIDYGTTNPTTFLLIGQGADKRLYVCAEWRWDSTKQGSQKTDAQYSEELKRFVKKTGCLSRLQFIFIDPSAA